MITFEPIKTPTLDDVLKLFIEKWRKDMEQPMSDEKKDGIIHCQADLLVGIIFSTHPV
jgi:hypothetical protein